MNSMNSSASEPSLSSSLATKNHLASKCFSLGAILQQLCVWLIQSDFIKVFLRVPCSTAHCSNWAALVAERSQRERHHLKGDRMRWATVRLLRAWPTLSSLPTYPHVRWCASRNDKIFLSSCLSLPLESVSIREASVLDHYAQSKPGQGRAA